MSLWSKRILLGSIGILLGLSLTELALGAFDLMGPKSIAVQFEMQLTKSIAIEPDETRIWRLKEGPEINRYGLRGYDPAAEKGPADLRVLCVGDSYTFGSGVLFEFTYGMQLERHLQALAPGARVETLIAGVPGYTTHQSRILMEAVAERFRPDLVVVCPGPWNDEFPASGLSDRAFAARRHWPRVARLLNELFFAHELLTEREAIDQLNSSEPTYGRRVPEEDYRDNLVAMARHAGGLGAEIVFLVPPTAPFLGEINPALLRYKELTKRVARESSVIVVDAHEATLAARETMGTPYDVKLAPFACHLDGHPDTLGHRIMAEALADELERPGTSRFRLRLGELAKRPRPSSIAIEWNGTRGAMLDVPPAVSDPETRVWIGSFLARRLDSPLGSLQFDATQRLPAGAYPVTIVTPNGTYEGQPAYRTDGPALTVRTSQDERQRRVFITCDAPPGAPLWLYIEPGNGREEPLDTQHGPLWIDLGLGRPEPPFAPLRFLPVHLPTPFAQGTVPESGTWHFESVVPTGFEGQSFVLQAIAGDQDHAVLSQRELLRLD